MASEKGEDPEEPMTVLIGGWAVYSYNKYYGSIDIDLVTNKLFSHRNTIIELWVAEANYGE